MFHLAMIGPSNTECTQYDPMRSLQWSLRKGFCSNVRAKKGMPDGLAVSVQGAGKRSPLNLVLMANETPVKFYA